MRKFLTVVGMVAAVLTAGAVSGLAAQADITPPGDCFWDGKTGITCDMPWSDTSPTSPPVP